MCEVMRALLLIRDLVMLALVDGRHGLTYKPLMEIFESVGRGSSRWQKLENEDKAQLSQAMRKIVQLGATTFDEFVERISVPTMFGPGLSDEQQTTLYAMYSTCSKDHPRYKSSNNSKGKVRGNSKANKEARFEDAAKAAGSSKDYLKIDCGELSCLSDYHPEADDENDQSNDEPQNDEPKKICIGV